MAEGLTLCLFFFLGFTLRLVLGGFGFLFSLLLCLFRKVMGIALGFCMTVIFITHDIGLAYYISDTVYIMEHGKFVEFGKADEVILNPRADYTKRLISDVPKIHEEWDLSTVDLLTHE